MAITISGLWSLRLHVGYYINCSYTAWLNRVQELQTFALKIWCKTSDPCFSEIKICPHWGQLLLSE